MQQQKPFIAVHPVGLGSNAFEPFQHIGLNLFQAGRGLLYVLGLHCEGQAQATFRLAQAGFREQHIGKFLTDRVKAVAGGWDTQDFPILRHIRIIADHGKLKGHRGAEIVDQSAVQFKDDRLIIVGRFGIAAILKRNAFAVKAVPQAAYPILIHFLIGNSLLGSGGNLTVALCPSDCLCELLFLCGT